MPMFTSFNIPILQARKLRPREVKLLSIAWAGGHGGSKICTQHSGSRPWLLSSSARGLIQGAQRGLGTCLRSLGAHRGGCKTFGPLEFLTGPLPWGELVLGIPMQGISGYKRLRAAGEAGARRTRNHQGVVLPLLNSAREARAAPPSRDPRVPRERARWPLDGAVTQQSGGRRESGVWRGCLPSPSRGARQPGVGFAIARPAAQDTQANPPASVSSPGQAAVSIRKTGSPEGQLKSRGPIAGAAFLVGAPLPSSPARLAGWSRILKLEVV